MKRLNIRLKSKFMLVFCSLMLLSVATVLTTSVYVFHRYEKELYRDTSLVLNMSVDSIEQKLSAVDTASSYVVMGNAVQDILQNEELDFSTSLSGIERSAFELLWSAFLRTFGGGLCQWKKFWYRGRLCHGEYACRGARHGGPRGR